MIEKKRVLSSVKERPYFSKANFVLYNNNKGQWDVSNGLKKDFEFQLSWIEACHRVLKPGDTIWISGTYHSIYQ